ncbi:protein rIIA [Xanthomonas phage Xoo-sp13]|nr:protein rIIA [Xanthomonas phage Xoo-sp13]
MELRSKSAPVTVSGAGKTMSFGIANNEKMFRILSDNLYQDKQGSIVREISCNALDGHTMAGTPERPFVIHLPDPMEPWLSIRDFGVGLSPEAVETVFCQYGESTKDQSNDAVGAFGLGAKTPFAYTDQFNVISNHNGTKYHYNAAIMNGIPQIMLMMESPTDEGNGVEVKIGVKPADFVSFETAVRQQLRFLPVKPIIENYQRGDKFEFEDFGTIAFESENIRVMNVSPNRYGNRNYIVQGPVGYAMDYDLVKPHLNAELRAFMDVVNPYGIHLKFNIGDIGVTASREGVEYNDFTILNIKNKIDTARLEVIAWLKGELARFTNVYDKARFINTNTMFSKFIDNEMDLKPAKRSTAGEYYFSIVALPEFTVSYDSTDVNGQTVTRTRNAASITEYTPNGNSGFSGSRSSESRGLITPDNTTKYAIVLRSDDVRAPIAKMRHYFLDNSLDRLYSVAVSKEVLVDKQLVKSLKNYLGSNSITVILDSELPDAPKAVYASSTTPRDYTRPTAYLNTNSNDLDSVANWERVYDKLDALEDENGDPVTEAIYMTVERQRTSTPYAGAAGIFYQLTMAGMVNDIPLYAIRTSDLDKLAKTNIKWIELSDFVQQKRQEILEDPKVKRYALALKMHTVLRGVVTDRLNSLVDKLETRSKIRRMGMLHRRVKDYVERAQVNSYQMNIASHDVGGHPALKIIQTYSENLYEKVPLLVTATRGSWGAFEEAEAVHMAAYVNHFDK